MQTADKLSYSLVVAILLVLFVILGTRTFYDEPEEPGFNASSQEWQQHDDDVADYHRNVFILSSALGVGAVALGLCLFKRVDAMPLGLLLGGLGVLIFGWAQEADEFDQTGEAPLFVVVAIGLVIVFGAGCWVLGPARARGDGEG